MQFIIFAPVKVQVDRIPPSFTSHTWLCLSPREGSAFREATAKTPEFTFLVSPSFPVQCMLPQPPRPKTACGACLKVSAPIFSVLSVCGGGKI